MLGCSKYSEIRHLQLCTPIWNTYWYQKYVKIGPFEAFFVLLQMYARFVGLLVQIWPRREHKVALTEIHPWRLYITRRYLFHITQCTIQNRNMHVSVLTGALWDILRVHCRICEFVLLPKRDKYIGRSYFELSSFNSLRPSDAYMRW